MPRAPRFLKKDFMVSEEHYIESSEHKSYAVRVKTRKSMLPSHRRWGKQLGRASGVTRGSLVGPDHIPNLLARCTAMPCRHDGKAL